MKQWRLLSIRGHHSVGENSYQEQTKNLKLMQEAQLLYYNHIPKLVLENEYNLYWDRIMPTDQRVIYNKYQTNK